MCPRHLWMKSRVPWTVWTSGRLNIAVSHGCIEALRPWHNPDLFSRGGSPGLGNVARCGHNRRINSRWGVVCEGMPTSGLWSEPQSRWHINRLELEAVFLALKDFRPQLEQRHVTELIWRFSTAWYGTVRHGSVRYGTAQFGSVCVSTAV